MDTDTGITVEDEFFTKKSCDRCGRILQVRTLSWFTMDVICGICIEAEDEIKKGLRDLGHDSLSFEECGYIPDLKLLTSKKDTQDKYILE